MNAAITGNAIASNAAKIPKVFRFFIFSTIIIHAKISEFTPQNPAYKQEESGFAYIVTIFADFENKTRWESLLFRLSRTAHPCGHGLSHALFEGGTESTIAAKTALVGQLLGGEGTLGGDGIVVKMDEVANA